MRVINKETLEFIETPGGNAGSALATPSRGAREVSVIRQRQAPGGNNPSHRHEREEVMVMLAGASTLTANGEPRTLATSDTANIPPGTLHSIANTGPEPAEWLLIAPAGVRFVHTSGEEGSPPWAR